MIGRGLFGIGAEMGYLSQSVITDLWFYGSFLTVAYSLNRMMTYVVMSLSTYFLPEVFLGKISGAEKEGLSRDETLRKAFTSVLVINVLLMLFVIVLSIIYKLIEWRRSKDFKG